MSWVLGICWWLLVVVGILRLMAFVTEGEED